MLNNVFKFTISYLHDFNSFWLQMFCFRMILSYIVCLALKFYTWKLFWYWFCVQDYDVKLFNQPACEAKLHTNITEESPKLLKPWYSIGGFEWICINNFKSAAFSLKILENSVKPL